jgi:hypothetical protein
MDACVVCNDKAEWLISDRFIDPRPGINILVCSAHLSAKAEYIVNIRARGYAVVKSLKKEES